MVQLSIELKNELLSGNIDSMGDILHRGWIYKKELASKISNPQIDVYYNLAMKNGALGGKLLGAGGGGFLLFYAHGKNHNQIRLALNDLEELNFNFSFEGTKILHYDN